MLNQFFEKFIYFIQQKIINIPFYDYFKDIIILSVYLLIIFLINSLILNKFKNIAKKPNSRINEFIIDTVRKNIIPILYISAIFIFLKELKFVDNLIFKISISIIISFFLIRFISRLFKYFFERYLIEKGEDGKRINSFRGIIPAFNIAVWIIGIIFILDNLGVNISTLLAGLGIGGIAVALASQAVLADLFSYFSMIFDRPFEIGDFIVIDKFMGTVEKIGVKTTRLRSLDGEELIFSNKDLTSSRVRNLKRMKKRRISFNLNVVYNTPLEKLKLIPQIVKNIIIKIKNTEFERAHFFSLGESSLIYEIVYYVLTSDYNEFMDIQENINFLIIEKFQEHKIEFANSTQTIQFLK